MHLGGQLAHAPRFCLWVSRVEVGEECVVVEVPQARGIVGHDVAFATNVGDFVVVAVVALVETGCAADVCRGTGGGGRAFSVSAHGWCVVATGSQCSFAKVVLVSGHVGLRQDTHLLEVAVG